MKRFTGYTRDHTGEVVKRTVQTYSNTLTCSCGSGNTTDGFVMELRRCTNTE